MVLDTSVVILGVVELLNANYNVAVVDNLSNSSEKVIDGIEKITGCIVEKI